ncbi:hypothetical protein Ancab_017259 [Ancistrocladus abbreviatus]
MAASQNTTTPYHSRSISLPSRPHPLIPQFDEQLSRLRSSEAASTSSTSISYKVDGLKELYNFVDEVLQLHLHQQTLRQHPEAKWIDVLLDGSLKLLNICSIARDVLSLTKKNVQDIQSVISRRCIGELSITREVVDYIHTRKKVKKTSKKCLKVIKSMQSKNDGSMAIVCMLSDVEATTAEIFESLLCHIAGLKTQLKKSSWSIVPKLMRASTVYGQEETALSEFGVADSVLNSLARQTKKTGINVVRADQLRSQITQIESAVQDLDEQLESLFRFMVKTRATLLNILKHSKGAALAYSPALR